MTTLLLTACYIWRHNELSKILISDRSSPEMKAKVLKLENRCKPKTWALISGIMLAVPMICFEVGRYLPGPLAFVISLSLYLATVLTEYTGKLIQQFED